MKIENPKGKIAAFTPVASFTPTVYKEPFQVFSFDDETIGLIIEVREYLTIDGEYDAYEMDVLIGEEIFCHTYNLSLEPDFRILEENYADSDG